MRELTARGCEVTSRAPWSTPNPEAHPLVDQGGQRLIAPNASGSMISPWVHIHELKLLHMHMRSQDGYENELLKAPYAKRTMLQALEGISRYNCMNFMLSLC